jgi:hypothetical protein
LKKTSTGSAAEETVRFALDDNSCEIDLNSAHAEAGRRTAGPARKTRKPTS